MIEKGGFFCGCHGCIYCNMNGYCQSTEKVNEDMVAQQLFCFGEDPYCFDSITKREDYSSEYWIHCRNKDGVHYRAKQKGKRLKVNGFVLFTQDKIYPNMTNSYMQRVKVTEQKTGICSHLAAFYDAELLKIIRQKVDAAVNVMDVQEGEANVVTFM